MKDNELIVCRDVSLGYEGKSVLTDLDLTIAKGDYLCVVGDNGSGKSTLMRGLLGLIQPQSGTIDPLIALPVGGIVGAIAMGKTRDMGHYFNAGLAKMSGVAMLLVGTGALSGIISNSGLKDVIISFIETLGLPGFMLAPISGMLMGAATASATAGTTLASQIFGPTVVASGVTPLAAAAMTHASCFVFDGLPHGSFFHVSAGGVNMEISERLKLLGYEAINGLAMMAVSTLVFGVLKLAG